MSKVKRQHFVPQFYLRNFASSNGRTYVFDKFEQRIYASNIEKVAAVNYFYDVPQEKVSAFAKEISEDLRNQGIEADEKAIVAVLSSQMVEQYLSVMEQRCSKVIEDVLESLEGRRRFKHKYRTMLAIFVAIQFLRTLAQRKSMMELAQKSELRVMELVNKLNEVHGTNTTAEDIGIAYDPDKTQFLHKFHYLQPETIRRFAEIFYRHIWYVGVNETANPLYTSDNPVVKHAHMKDDWRGNNGIASPGIEIVIPITPKYLFILLDRIYFKHAEARENTLRSLSHDNILRYNSLQVDQSTRQVFSISDNFELALTICKEEPEICDPNRELWDVG